MRLGAFIDQQDSGETGVGLPPPLFCDRPIPQPLFYRGWKVEFPNLVISLYLWMQYCLNLVSSTNDNKFVNMIAMTKSILGDAMI